MSLHRPITCAALLILAVVLSGCGSGGSDNAGSPAAQNPQQGPADTFVTDVSGIATASPENTEPAVVDAIVVTKPETTEPVTIL